MLFDGFRATAKARGYGSRLEAGTTIVERQSLSVAPFFVLILIQ
jgi:hypothetical protein